MPLNNESMGRRSFPRFLRWALLFVLMAVRPLGPFCGRVDDLDCELAAQHLTDCCHLTSPLRCTYRADTQSNSQPEGCHTRTTINTNHIADDLLPDVALCVRNTSCEDLVRAGACSIAAWLLPADCDTTNETTTNNCGIEFEHYQCDTVTTTICNTRPQFGACSTYRPQDACDALQRISCALAGSL